MTKFSRCRFLTHAGGRVSERNYTKSVEAFETSTPVVPLIEFDIISALDGLIVAHGGLEDPFFKSFSRRVQEEKYLNTLSTMALPDFFASEST